MAAMRENYGENKRNILMAGRAIIAQKGFSAVGLSEILAAAAIPKGSFYHYFGSKEQYGRELIEHYVAGYLELLERVLRRSAYGASARAPAQLLGLLAGKPMLPRNWSSAAWWSSCPPRWPIFEDMRHALHQGTQRFIDRIAACIARACGSLAAHRARSAGHRHHALPAVAGCQSAVAPERDRASRWKPPCWSRDACWCRHSSAICARPLRTS
jgi:TetR/AcrR family transcriptional repressor of nem operon